ncbi:MAG: GldG family protein [Clostridia bacterium]|nr:GldG family protein [Clostridia bacterium]
MENNSSLHSRKFKYGSLAVLMTCVIIAAVILVNVLFTALASKFLWYTDLTSESLYTLSDAAVDAIKDIEQDVDIIFCDNPDALMSNSTQRYVYETALGLEKANKKVHVSTVDIWRNPTAVNKYKANSKSKIYSTSIIVASGTEFRVYTLRSMFVFNSDTDDTPWSYNGEKKLCAAILAVTKAEAPVCLITYTHGEPFVGASDLAANSALLELLTDAGYRLRLANLTNDSGIDIKSTGSEYQSTELAPGSDIFADARLMLIYDPQDDFLVKDGISDISEIEKLDKFLDGTNALMVFVSPSTPKLPNLEEYLEEWGVTFNRTTNALGVTNSNVIRDLQNSVTANGLGIVGSYTSKGLGASIHSDMRTTYPPKVIFPECMGISYAKNYYMTNYEDENDSSKNFSYYTYYSNGVPRAIYDVFTSSSTAEELVNGLVVNTATALDPFKLMTITRESRMADNTTEDYSYVLACGSVEFLQKSLLQSNTYGNSDVMLSALRAVGKELAIANLTHKPFASTKIENITTAEANRYTAILVIVPAVAAIGVGVYVLVRRKYSR